MEKKNYKKIAKQVIDLEIQALKKLKNSINDSFNQAVNGTLTTGDWGIRVLSTATTGDITYDVAISDIQNATSAGIGRTDASAADELHSYVSSGGSRSNQLCDPGTTATGPVSTFKSSR